MDIPGGKLRGLDLFSGIGGISEALEPWVETVAYCERERYPQAVLLSRMERGEIDVAPIWDDVCTLRGEILPRIDILTGGWPCQGNSTAGKRKGMEDVRSGLVKEVIRLVGEIRPNYVFLENVAGAVTAPGDGLGYILQHMAKLRYDCRWGVFGIEGAPHSRKRLFLLAHSGGIGWPKVLHDGAGERQKEGSGWEGVALDTPGATLARFEERCGEPAIFGVDDVRRHPYTSERLKCHGNQVAPSQAREAFKRLIGLE